MPTDPTTPTVPKPINWGKIIATIVVVLVVVGLIAGGIYWYVQNQTADTGSNVTVNTNKTATSSATKSQSLSEKVGRELVVYDSMYDTSTKAGTLHTIQLKAPKSWTFKNDNSKNKNTGGHYYSFTGANKFLLEISEMPGGIGFSCPPENIDKDAVVSSEKITSNGETLYINLDGSLSKNQVEKAFLSNVNTDQCSVLLVSLKTPKSATSSVNLSVFLSFQKTLTKEAFLTSAEYKAAKELLQSLTVVN